MPTITFRILSTAEQLQEVKQDFQALIAALDNALDADFELSTDLVPDPELEATWVELFGETDPDDPTTGSELKITVRRYDLGSISGLTMHFAELLIVRDEPPAEPLLREVQDDPGTPRVPWHVSVNP